ncbi:cullin family protein, putative [Eimeria acervulina]|uniref:Cullin family protein, putative n=1 Tax=Eimeria acervulina TaxID=5801 RepID=U6GSL3_EIMAC|nr:cullin family protein, putative [Eimeria acervulina]CDI83246.1 cullin family protein, putative [Eimeria acervulina]
MEGHGELVTLEEGWTKLRLQGIEKVQRFLEQRPERGHTTKRVCVVSNEDYAAIYTMVYTMCTQRSPYNFSQDLYHLYGDSIVRYVHSTVLPSLENRRGSDLLEELLCRWENHRTLVKWLQKFFAYLDRYYVKMYMEAPLVKRGIAIFKDHVFERVKQPVSAAIEEAIRRQREGESLDEESVAQLVCMYIGLDPEDEGLGLYQRELEDLLLASTKQFYDRKAREWIASSTFAEYLQLTEAALEAEARRCERYLHSSSSSKLLGVVVKSTLQQHQQELLEKDTAIPFLLAGEGRAELRLAHRLFALVDGAVEDLAKQFKMYISACGEKLVQQRIAAMRETQQMRAQGSNSSNSNAALSQQQQRQQDIICEHRFVESVLDLHDRFKSITLDCFRAQPRISQDTFGSSTRPAPQADSLFQKALKEGPYCVLATTRSSQYGVPVFPERHIIVGLFPCMRFPGAFIAFSLIASAFESFVNAQSLQPPFAQLLASFCDRILRKAGGERMGDEEIEECLMKVVEIFNYVTDKDLFAEQYRTQLGRRLLHETSASLELERLLIAKLRLKCGAHFTAKVEGMVNDLQVAAGLMRAFQQQQQEEQLKKQSDQRDQRLDDSVACLKDASVPSASLETVMIAPDLRLPPELAQCVGAFEQFYASQTQHRKLTWVNSLGTALVAAQLQKRQDLICNTMQATLLLRFNRKQDDGTSGNSGCCAGDPALSVQQLVEDLRLDELTVKKLLGSLMLGRFKILKKGENDMFQVNGSFSCLHRKIKLPTPVQEETQCRARVEEDRSITVDAAIVRIMKTRKSLSHQQLVGEVMAQLHFFQPPAKLLKERIQDLIAREFLERDKDKPTQYNYVA